MASKDRELSMASERDEPKAERSPVSIRTRMGMPEPSPGISGRMRHEPKGRPSVTSHRKLGLLQPLGVIRGHELLDA